MNELYLRIKNWLRRSVPTGGVLWHILVSPQRFQRHGLKLLKEPFFAKEMKKLVEPLQGRQLIKDHVSIVINSAGRLECLQKTIEALRRSFDYDPIKTSWLIIDDYPNSHETRAYIKSLDWFDVVILNERNRGLGYSINKIFSEIRSEFVFYCQEDRELLRPVPIQNMIHILRDNPHFSQLLLSNEDKPFPETKEITKGLREYYRMFGFSPYLASVEFMRNHLPFPFYFTNVEFSFKLHKKGWRVSGVFGGEDEPPYARHSDLSDTRKVWVVK